MLRYPSIQRSISSVFTTFDLWLIRHSGKSPLRIALSTAFLLIPVKPGISLTLHERRSANGRPCRTTDSSRSCSCPCAELLSFRVQDFARPSSWMPLSPFGIANRQSIQLKPPASFRGEIDNRNTIRIVLGHSCPAVHRRILTTIHQRRVRPLMTNDHCVPPSESIVRHWQRVSSPPNLIYQNWTCILKPSMVPFLSFS